jgi:hypothetical protein
MVRDHDPPGAATVPREAPFSKISMVVPDSAVPVSVNSVPELALSAGDTMRGAAGAVVSTRRTTYEDALELPVASLAVAVNR